MKTHGILRMLLVTTSVSTAVCGMDAQNYAGTRDFDLMNPDRSFGKQVLTRMKTDVKEGIVKDTQEFRVLAKKALNGDWASVTGVGIHQLIYSNFKGLAKLIVSKLSLTRSINP